MQWHPHTQARDESLFALANGSLGVRGGLEEAHSASDGCYLAGVYERHPIHYHERLAGFARSTDTRLPVADGKYIAIVLGDEAIDPATCELLAFERSLDLREGCLRRSATWRTPKGATVRVHSQRLVSAQNDLLAIRFRVTSIDYEGPITLASSIQAGRRAAGQSDDPRIGVACEGSLAALGAHADRDGARLAQRTERSGIGLCCAQSHRIVAIDEEPLAFEAAGCDDDSATQSFAAQLQPGRSVELEKFVAYAHGAAVDASALQAAATQLAEQAAQRGHQAFAHENAQHLQAFWDDAALETQGDPRSQLALRFNLFHLLQSAAGDGRNGTAAKGMTGEGYEGHCFWDTEVFALPVMVFTAPSIARAMLLYRHRTLDAARANARQMHHARGALYAWRTIAGGECSAHYPSGSAAYHINADIAYAIGLYFDATGDVEFLLQAGAEMLFETARIWLQVGHFDPLRNGEFGIYDVTGPDEYTALVDNNFYTNRMAQRHLQRAAAVWELLQAEHTEPLQAIAAQIGLDAEEVALWRQAAQRMRLPYEPALGIYAQDDTFLHKPRWSEPPQDAPLLLDVHPLTLYRHQVCKQADVVMALAIAGDGLDADAKRRSFEYYEPITTHDSTLSAAIHGIVASELGLRDAAWRFFQDALRVDLDDLHGNTHHGVHMAAMAGSWLGVAWGFAGLRVVDGELRFAPTLPHAWQGYRLGLHWRGRRIALHVQGDRAEYALREGEPLRIFHDGQTQLLRAEAPLLLPLRARTQAMPAPADAVHNRDAHNPDARGFDALIFDLDGVLTDTAHLHYQAWKRLADEIGVPFDHAINRRLKGVDRQASLEIILERAQRAYSSDEKHALTERKNGYYQDAIAGFGADDLYPGARELLLAARAAGLRTALASASRNAAALVAKLGIAELFDAVIDPAGIANAKPAPDIFLAAANALDVPAHRCIGIEDAAAGVAAIKAADMPAIGIGDARELAQADAVFAHIRDLSLSRMHAIAASVSSPAPDASGHHPQASRSTESLENTR